MLGRLGKSALFAVSMISVVATSGGAQWVKSASRSLTLCSGGYFGACVQVMMTTRLFSNGYGETILGFRNLQGERPEDTTGGSILTSVYFTATTSLWPGDTGTIEVQQPTPVSAVHGDGGGSSGWAITSFQHQGVNVRSGGSLVPDPVYGLIPTAMGIGGCTPFAQRVFFMHEVSQALPSYSTCTTSGYPGMLTLQYSGYHLASPNYFDNIGFEVRTQFGPTGSGFQGCSTRWWGPGSPKCTVVEDVFEGDSFNDPLVTPEPGTLLLLSTGLAGVGAIARRRRRG